MDPAPRSSGKSGPALRCPRCGDVAAVRLGARCPNDGAALCVEAEIPPRGDPNLGEVLNGRYPIVGVLGRGGMGAVYRGIQEPLGRPVALKVIRPDAAAAAGTDSNGEETSPLRRRFFREAQAIAALSHPGIVSLYDYGETPDGLLFMVMELIDGPSLRQIVKATGPLAPARVVTLARQVLDALAHAHAQGVVHRDLKPGNVMLQAVGTREERARLLDFGVAKVFAMGPEPAEVTHDGTGRALGTPRYMAPEQIVGGEITARTDLYAMGVMLYTLLTGRPPFDGPSSYHIHRLHQEAPVPPFPPELGVSVRLEEAVRWALEKDPIRRPPSARALASALEDGLAGEPGTQPESAPVAPAASGRLAAVDLVDETSGHGERFTRSTPPRPGASLPWRWVGGMMVLAAVGGFVGVRFLGPSPVPTPTPGPTPASHRVITVTATRDAGVAATPSAPPRPPPPPPMTQATAPPVRRPPATPLPSRPPAGPSRPPPRPSAPEVKVERL